MGEMKHTIALGLMPSASVTAIVQCLQCNYYCTTIIMGWAEENRACLLVRSDHFHSIQIFGLSNMTIGFDTGMQILNHKCKKVCIGQFLICLSYVSISMLPQDLEGTPKICFILVTLMYAQIITIKIYSTVVETITHQPWAITLARE